MFNRYNNVKDWLHELSSIIRRGATVTQFSYRTARVKHRLVDLDRNDDDVMKFEVFLAESASTIRDNHTTYKVTFEDGESFAIGCTDGHIFLGIGIIEERW